MIENVIDTVENCRYCLMCRHVAPVGVVTGQEALTPHGVALVIASQRRGMFDWDADSVAVVFAEEDGGNCRAHCVTDQPLPAAAAAVRAQIVEADLAPPAVYDVYQRLQQWSTPFASQAPEAAEGKAEAALFAGDEATYLWPSALPAAEKLLAATGVEAVTFGRGQSNGFMAQTLGFPGQATATVEAIIAMARQTGASRMFVLSAGDYFVFTQMIDERLGITWPDGIEVVDLATFLAERAGEGQLSFGKTADSRPYAYVDPTHAVRAPFRFNAVRALAASVMNGPAVELFWRRDRAHPVGSTGVQFGRPEIAERLTRARLEDARKSGAEILVCEDPATLAHLDALASEYGLEVQGLYELLADNLQ